VRDVNYSEAWTSAGATVSGDVLAWIPLTPQPVTGAWYSPSGERLADGFEDVDVQKIRLSPDATTALAEKRDPSTGADDLWTIDLRRGTHARLNSSRGDEEVGAWLPDGGSVLYSSDGNGPYAIERRAADGLSQPQVLLSDPPRDWAVEDISRDGRSMLASKYPLRDLWLIPVDAPGNRKPWLATEAQELEARFSPDGEWIAFMWDRSGSYEVHARRVAGGAAVRISDGAGANPRWAPDGRAIYYEANRRVMKVTLTRSGSQLAPSSPAQAIPGIANLVDFDVARDGRLLVLATPGDRQSRVRVRVGWRE
jgi:Tol biopolymer transport system component